MLYLTHYHPVMALEMYRFHVLVSYLADAYELTICSASACFALTDFLFGASFFSLFLSTCSGSLGNCGKLSEAQCIS
jgi:hypothetical protein